MKKHSSPELIPILCYCVEY